MVIMDWLFVGLISVTILFFIVGLFCIFFSIRLQGKLKEIKRRRPKGKKKRRIWQKKVRAFAKRQKSWLIKGVALIALAIFTGCSGAYTRYYQMTNLSGTDSEVIVQSYFLIDEIEKELISIQQGSDPEKSAEKMQDMLNVLVSYTTNVPSNALNKEGQQILRKYYTKVKEWAVNVFKQPTDKLKDQKVVEEYLADIEGLRKEQEKVFKQFKINESALEQKK